MQAIMCLVPVCMFQIHVWFIVRAVVSQFTSVVMTGLFAPVFETVDRTIYYYFNACEL